MRLLVPEFTHAEVPTQHDTNDLAHYGFLYVGGAGAVKFKTIGGETVTMSAVPAGSLLPVKVAQVWSTGTTATALLVVWK